MGFRSLLEINHDYVLAEDERVASALNAYMRGADKESAIRLAVDTNINVLALRHSSGQYLFDYRAIIELPYDTFREQVRHDVALAKSLTAWNIGKNKELREIISKLVAHIERLEREHDLDLS